MTSVLFQKEFHPETRLPRRGKCAGAFSLTRTFDSGEGDAGSREENAQKNRNLEP
jgi:hypothetical protein